MKNLCAKIIGVILFIIFHQSYTIKAQCGNDAGTMPQGFFPACAGNFVGSVALNPTIAEENSSLIYLMHRGSETSTTILLDSLEAYNSTGIFYNDGTIRRNQNLFISAYVGLLNQDGSPVLDDDCAVVALPGAPIRFYEPIELNDVSNNCDSETGCSTVQFFITGGAPGFPGNILFEYDINGDFSGELDYGQVGSFTVCNASAYTIEVFNDGKGCTGFFEVTHVCCKNNLVINNTTPFQNLYQYKAPKVRLNNNFSTKTGAEFKVRNGGCN